MDKRVKRLTSPYIYDGIVGCFVDVICGLVLLLLCAIDGIDSRADLRLALLMSGILAIVLMATMDAPMMIKCMLDRKEQCVLTATGILEDILPDRNWSYKFKITSGSDEYYYPKSWQMSRYRLALRTKDGRLEKPRSIYSIAHGQYQSSNIVNLQRKLDQPIVLKVRYLKDSKTIVDVTMESYPTDMKKRTAEYIKEMLADITRWTVKSH